MDVVLLDYGAGNLASVIKALTATGATPRVAADPADLASADAIVIPGVGHFEATTAIDGTRRLAIQRALNRGVPLIGICLGLQWLFEGSDEAPHVSGLGAFPGRCFHLGVGGLQPGATIARPIKVPHVGWNSLDRTERPSRLLDGIATGATAYFTHSYAAPLVAETTASTTHRRAFSSVVERDLVFGVQFHPEKSGATGLRVLSNFLGIARGAR